MSTSEQQYLDARERVVQEVAAKLGIPVDEVRNTVNSVLGAPEARPELSPTAWETIRRTPKPPANLSWQQQQQFYRDHAHEVWVARNGWKHYVLKSYQRSRGELDKDQYARAFCLVDGYESELGDVYWRDITAGATRIR